MNKYKLLYEIFKVDSRPKKILTNSSSITKKELDALFSKELKELTENDLSHYIPLISLDNNTTFFYFLPRILELSFEDEFIYPDPEIIFKIIYELNWDSWTLDKKRVIIDLINLKINDLCAFSNDGALIEQWLCAVSFFINDLTNYLRKLESNSSSKAFHGFVNWNIITTLPKQKLSNDYWKYNKTQEKQVLMWMDSKVVKQYLNLNYGIT